MSQSILNIAMGLGQVLMPIYYCYLSGILNYSTLNEMQP